MSYVDSDGVKKKPIMIHRALFGSIERFFGILIEHFEGAFPLWLAPVQVKLLTVTHEVKEYTDKCAAQLRAQGFRVQIDDTSEKIGYKIRLAASEKHPYLAIIGKTEAETNTLSLRQHKVGDIGSMPIEDAIQKWKDELKFVDT